MQGQVVLQGLHTVEHLDVAVLQGLHFRRIARYHHFIAQRRVHSLGLFALFVFVFFLFLFLFLVFGLISLICLRLRVSIGN
ncbi:hypothetical protein D9M71_800530 [compost metagenome]